MRLFEELPENSVILALGPSLEGKKELLYEYLANCFRKNEPVLFITTDNPAENIKIDLVKNKIFYGGKSVKFIDCYARQANESVPDTEDTKRVPGPLALNEMSIAIAEAERDIYAKNPKHRVIFNSLSTLLLYSNTQAIARFLQVLIARVKNSGGSGFFSIEKNMHDEQVITTMVHLMDGVVEFEKREGKIMAKTKGFGSESWETLG